jgi:neurexin
MGSSLKFLFKTNEPTGLLGLITPSTPFYSTSQSSRNLVIPNYLAVELLDGVPSLLINLGNHQAQRVTCPTTKLNDNNWHTIQIKRERLGAPKTPATPATSTITFSCDETSTRTQVDDEQKFSFSMFTAGNVTGNSDHHLPSDLYHSRSPHFYGCISDFELTGNRVSLYQATSPDSRATLVNGCQHDAAGLCHTMFRCLNRGECVEGFNRAYCSCDTVSYSGERCETAASTLTFNGSQGVEYALVELNRAASEEVSLRFRTPLRSGLLFALKKYQNDVVMSIGLEDGRVKVVYDRGANEKVVYVGDELDLFNTNKWHTVSVRRFGAGVEVRVVDDERNEYAARDDLGGGYRESEYRMVELGSVGSESLVGEYPNFIGWIQNVRFNGDDLLAMYVDGDGDR